MKQLITFLLFLFVTCSISFAQGITPPQGVVRVTALPATCVAVGADNSSAPVRYRGVVYTCTATNTWSDVTGTVAENDIDTLGKDRRGVRAYYAVASLPTCNSARREITVNVTDGNKGQRTCRNTTGSTYAWVDDDPVYRPERFGGKTSAGIQAAHDAAFTAGGGTVALDGTYAISATVQKKSNVSLVGTGINSTSLTAASGLSGAVVQLVPHTDTYNQNAEISNLTIDASAQVSESTAILGSTADFNLRLRFLDLRLLTNNGIILSGYSQSCVIDNVAHTGARRRSLWIVGNLNRVPSFFSYGTSFAGATEPVVEFNRSQTAGASDSQGNVVGELDIEGDIADSRSVIKIDTSKQLLINRIWLEVGTRTTAGKLIEIVSSPDVRINSELIAFTQGLIHLSSTSSLNLAGIDTSAYDTPALNWFSADSTSFIRIGKITDRRGQSSSTANIQVEESTYSNAVPTGFVGRNSLVPKSHTNRFKDASFEGSLTNWTVTGSATLTSATSTFTGGKMGVLTASSTSNFYLTQAVTVATEDSGKPKTIGGWVYVPTGSCAYINLTDLTNLQSGAHRIEPKNEWQFISATVTPSNGTYSLGIAVYTPVNGQAVYLDEFSLVAGNEPGGYNSTHNEVILGANRNWFSTGSAAPVSGTWKQGDIVFNIAPAALGVAGWQCTTAGTPGTWTAFYTNNQATGTSSNPTFGTVTATARFLGDASGVAQLWSASGRLDLGAASGRTVLYKAGSAIDHYFDILNASDASKIILRSNGQTYFDGGNVAIGATSGTEKFEVTGNIALTTAGNALKIKTGSNACAGWATLSSGSVVVSTTCIGTLETDTGITLTPKGSSTGVLRISATTASTSFTITSTDAGSADKVYWQITKLN